MRRTIRKVQQGGSFVEGVAGTRRAPNSTEHQTPRTHEKLPPSLPPHSTHTHYQPLPFSLEQSKEFLLGETFFVTFQFLE